MKTILITGGTRGIGRATALLCAANGWSVALNYVPDELAAEQTVREVQRAGGKAAAFRGDVAVEADVVAVFDAAERRVPLRPGKCPPPVQRQRRQGRLRGSHVFSGQPVGFALRIRRLCRVEGSFGHIGDWLGQGIGATGSSRQCGSSRTDRNGNSRQRRTTGPGETSRRYDADGPRRAPRGSRRGDRLA